METNYAQLWLVYKLNIHSNVRCTCWKSRDIAGRRTTQAGLQFQAALHIVHIENLATNASRCHQITFTKKLP